MRTQIFDYLHKEPFSSKKGNRIDFISCNII